MMRIRTGLIVLGVLGTGLSAWQAFCTDDTPLAAGEKETAIVEASEGSPDATSRKKPRPATNDLGKPAASESKSTPNAPLAPPKPREKEAPNSTRVLSTAAIGGRPFGVGQIVIRIPGHSVEDWYSDRLPTVNCDQNRVFYEVFHPQRRPADDKQEDVGTVTAYFLFQASEDLDLDVLLGDQTLVSKIRILVRHDEKSHHRLLGKWWDRYCADSLNQSSPELEPVRRYFMEMLARRMELPLPPHVGRPHRASNLEQQFERTVGMLFGFESVRLAMMEDDQSASRGSQEKAILRLPQALRIAQVRVPTNFPETNIEPIANVTPQECFYLRCGRLKNYLWIRRLIMDWGGSMDEIVATRVVKRRIRQRIENQLALDPDAAMGESIDEELNDLALIGCDTYFQDGAALGVIFEGSPQSRRLGEILKAQREASRAATGAKEGTVRLENHEVSFLSTPDHRVRSFYAVVDNHHLVTNSRHLATRFLQAVSGIKPLGNLKEFRYARSQLEEDRNYAAFLFLSDPFFRKITSPGYRIERSRRKHAIRDLESLHLARLAADAEDHSADTIPELVKARFLPHGFGNCADRSHPLIQGEELVDSLRGVRGTFLPVADVSISRATPSEVSAYAKFTTAYRREWPMIDPVSVAFSRKPSQEPDREQVVLDVRISPYARQEYRFLPQHLRPSQKQRVAMADEELLGLSGRLGGTRRHFDVHMGIMDAPVPFRIHEGELQRLDEFENTTFAKRQTYVAVTPEGKGGLEQMRKFVESIQRRTTLPRPTDNSRSKRPLFWWNLVRSGSVSPLTFLHIGLRSIAKLHKLSLIDDGSNHWGTWSILSENGQLRTKLLPQLRFETRPRSAQVSFQLRDVKNAQVMEYLKAYTYINARRVSAFNARFLNQITARLNSEPQKTRRAIERALGAELVCPVGGVYDLQVGRAKQPRWVSSAWKESSLADVDQVPHEYRFAFLDWLRGLEIEFSLSRNSLNSQLELEVRRNSASPLHGMTVLKMPKTKGAEHRVVKRRKPVFREWRAKLLRVKPAALASEDIRITNRTDRPFKYEVGRASGSAWGGPHTIKPNHSHRFEVDYAIRVRYRENSRQRMQTIQPKSQMEYRVP